MNKRQLIFILGSALIVILSMFVLEQILKADYIVKTAIKLALLIALPLLYSTVFKDHWIKKTFQRPIFAYPRLSIALSILVFTAVIGAYWLLKDYLSVQHILSDLENKYGIHANTFIYYGLYIIFVNSFVEEYFFRGYLFLALKHLGHRTLGYVFSALAFALYHMAIFKGWFSLPVYLLALFGLTAGGILFNFLDDRPDSFVNSWMVHISADLAIILIGFELFKT